MIISIRTKVEVIVVIVLLCLVWYVSGTKHTTSIRWQSAPPAKQIIGTPMQIVDAPKGVTVYTAQAKTKLKLAPSIQSDPNQQVISANQVKPDLHSQVVITIFNPSTGQSKTIARRDPYPWLAPEHTGNVWLGYGLSRGQRTMVISATEELLQVKALHFGVNALIMTDGAVFAGGSVGYKW